MKNFIVEPVICIYMFVSSMETPLVQQYIYRRLWEETTNTTFIDNDTISHCELNQSNPAFLKQKEVQEKASLFTMKTELCSAILSILMAFVLVANGDRCGRKWSLSLPLVGNLLGSTFLSFMSYFSLQLPLLFAVSFVTGLFGGMATFFGGAFSYVVDLSENQRQKTVRIAVVDLLFGLMSGLGGVASGYILKRIGFTWTFVTASLLQVVNIFYVTCCLEETVKTSGCQPHSLREGIKDTFSGVWLLFKLSSCRKRATIILLLCVFMTYLFTMFGGFSLYTLYELNAPLCWNAVYIGYGSAVSTSVSLTGFLGLLLLSRCLGDAYLVCIGIISYVGGAVMAAFANTTLLMFLARVPSFLLFVPIPVLRSMLSKVVLPKEQGALFACIACLEVVTGTTSVAVFNKIYAMTVAWFPGFIFLLSAGLCILPLSLLSSLKCVTQCKEDFVQLVNEEDSLRENVDS